MSEPIIGFESKEKNEFRFQTYFHITPNLFIALTIARQQKDCPFDCITQREGYEK